MAYGWFGSIPEKNLSLDEFLDFDGILGESTTKDSTREGDPITHDESEHLNKTEQNLQESISPPSGFSSVDSLPYSEELHEGCITDLEWVSRIVEDSYFIPPEVISPVVLAPVTNHRGSHHAPPKKWWLPFSMDALHVSTRQRRKRRPRSSLSTWPVPPFTASLFLESDKRSGRKPNLRSKPAEDTTEMGLVRQCSHCGEERTPQWRAGPLGAKTLCNACGVRYKSGRLLPEYRPAASPTFVNHVHSNSHRRVLEMRRRKGLLPPAGTRVADSGSERSVLNLDHFESPWRM